MNQNFNSNNINQNEDSSLLEKAKEQQNIIN